MYFHFPLVGNEPQLSELIQKATDAGPRGADHLGERLLADLRNDWLRLAFFPIVGQQEERSRQPLLSRIEEMID